MIFRTVAPALASALIFGALAVPAIAADGPCPSGHLAILRINKITPNGTMAGLKQATADHAKWYADHGFGEDRVALAPVLVYDAAKTAVVAATDTVLSLHTHAHYVPQDKKDAAWDAYIAEYRANADIVSETMTCLPD